MEKEVYTVGCPRCNAPRKQDSTGKIIYLRSYTCGSYGNLAIESDFTQTAECMQAQIKLLQKEVEWKSIGYNSMTRRVAELEEKVKWFKSMCGVLLSRNRHLKGKLEQMEGKFQELCAAVRRYLHGN